MCSYVFKTVKPEGIHKQHIGRNCTPTEVYSHGITADLYLYNYFLTKHLTVDMEALRHGGYALQGTWQAWVIVPVAASLIHPHIMVTSAV